jgi:ubiquinone/menaquinone biosynthesis C-methylase UbiE
MTPRLPYGTLTPPRRHDPELMDAPGLPPEEVADAYRVLRRVNRHLGNRRTLLRELRRFLDDVPSGSTPISILDVGSGSGDLPDALRSELSARAIPAHVLSVDRDPIAATEANRLDLFSTRGDAMRLPFADASIDLVTAIKFAHHFSDAPLVQLLAEMTRVARRRVVILDIRRHWLAYWGFVAWSHVFTSNRLVRYDGPLSVLRGFTANELLDLARPFSHFSWTLRASIGFQLALVGRRIAPPLQ